MTANAEVATVLGFDPSILGDTVESEGPPDEAVLKTVDRRKKSKKIPLFLPLPRNANPKQAKADVIFPLPVCFLPFFIGFMSISLFRRLSTYISPISSSVFRAKEPASSAGSPRPPFLH
jgi:hypothetical protein